MWLGEWLRQCFFITCLCVYTKHKDFACTNLCRNCLYPAIDIDYLSKAQILFAAIINPFPKQNYGIVI